MPRNMNWSDQERVSLWLSARSTRNPILETMRDTFDSGDAWASVMGWWFAIADVITEIDASQIPSEWQFRQSPLGRNTEAYEYEEIIEAMRSEGATLETLLHAGQVLTRYAAQLKLAGLDY